MSAMASKITRTHDCLLSRLFRRKENIKALRHWPLGGGGGDSSVTSEFSAQRASNAENVDDVIINILTSFVIAPCLILVRFRSFDERDIVPVQII